MVSDNPFKPSFGIKPPLLVGRDEIVSDFEQALGEGPGALGSTVLITGVRGAGKSVMLSVLAETAVERSWIAVREIAGPGLVERLVTDELPKLLEQVGPTTEWRLKSAGGLGVSASWEGKDRYPHTPGLRTLLEDLCRGVTDRNDNAGVVIVLDEVHGRDARDELRQIGHVYQLLIQTGHRVCLVTAGLPHAVEQMLNDDVLTFLRRSARYEIGNVQNVEARHAIDDPITTTGRRMSDDALAFVAEESHGYPFLIQLIGAQLCRNTAPGDTIDLAVARRAAALAVPMMRRLIHEPALADLSRNDRAYLAAMAIDDGPSRQQDLAERLGVDHSYASQYRLRLLAAEVIRPGGGRGYVEFSMPYLRDTVRELIGVDPRITQRVGIDHAIEPPQQRVDKRLGPEIS